MIEVKSRRSRRGRHYVDGRGNYRFESIAGTDLHYREGDQWLDIDMRPGRVNNAQFDGWRVTKNGWHYAIGQPAEKGSDGWIGFGGRAGQNWFLFRLARAGFIHWPSKSYSNLATADYDRANLNRENERVDLNVGSDPLYVASRATWADVMPGVDLQWVAEGRGLKELITVDPAVQDQALSPATPPEQTYFGFVFEIDASGMPRITVDNFPKRIDRGFDSEGAIEFRSEDMAELIAFMPVDYVTVDQGEAEPARLRLRRRFYRYNGKDYLIVGARVDHLAQLPPGPWVFDPTFTDQPDEGSSKDTYIDDDNPTTNYGTSPGLHWQRGSIERIILMEFDCSSIPVDAVCTSAELQLTSYSVGYSTNDCEAHPLHVNREAWHETQATWNQFNSGNNWSTPGCYSATTDYIGASQMGTGVGPGAANTAYTINLDNDTSIIEGWFGPSNTNYGIRISSISTGYCNNWSSNGSAAYRPKLTIQYAGATPDPASAAASAVAPSVVLGSVAVTPDPASAVASAAGPTVLSGSVPPIVIGHQGNTYIETLGKQVAVMLLTTEGSNWRLLTSGSVIEKFGLEITRYVSYLTPE